MKPIQTNSLDIIAANAEAKRKIKVIFQPDDDIKGKGKEVDEETHWPQSSSLDASFANKLQRVDDMKEVTKQDFDDKLIAIEIKLLTMDDKLTEMMEMLKKIKNCFI